MIHAAISLVIAGLIARTLPDSNLVILLFLAIALFPGVFLAFAVFPQLMFKSAERQLTLNETGWTTTIGNESGSRAWSDIVRVEEAAGNLEIVSRGGNALIVPARALPNPDRWKQFVVDVEAWHHAAAA